MTDWDVVTVIAVLGVAAWGVARLIPGAWSDRIVVSPDVLGSVALSQMLVSLGMVGALGVRLLTAYNRAVIAGLLVLFVVRTVRRWRVARA